MGTPWAQRLDTQSVTGKKTKLSNSGEVVFSYCPCLSLALPFKSFANVSIHFVPGIPCDFLFGWLFLLNVDFDFGVDVEVVFDVDVDVVAGVVIGIDGVFGVDVGVAVDVDVDVDVGFRV